jgi:two-component system cell cycle response regulator DivK
MPARILIIEDDHGSRELLLYLLRASGHVALEAADGGAGVRLALQANPDLVLCDLQMPVMNGYEVMRALQDNPDWRRVPVIAVSAFSMAGDRNRVLDAGFDEHITKPIVPETFVGQIEAHLVPALRAGPVVR